MTSSQFLDITRPSPLLFARSTRFFTIQRPKQYTKSAEPKVFRPKPPPPQSAPPATRRMQRRPYTATNCHRCTIHGAPVPGQAMRLPACHAIHAQRAQAQKLPARIRAPAPIRLRRIGGRYMPHIPSRFNSDIPPQCEIRFYKSKTVFWKSLRLLLPDGFSFFNIIRNAPTRISISRPRHVAPRDATRRGQINFTKNRRRKK